MRRPSRRTTVVVSAVLAAALGAGGVVALVTTGDQATSRLTALDDTPATTPPSETPEPTAPSETPTPEPSATTTSDAPDPTTQPPSRPAATSSGPARHVGDYGPRPPGSITMPYRAGQTTWDVSADGIRLLISMTPAKVGESMTWSVRASSAEADCCAVYMLFGDGFGTGGGSGVPCGSPDPTVSYPHTYNRAGRHEFMVSSYTKKCSGSEIHVYGTFDVGPGTPTSQGPELPTVKFDRSTPVKGHEDDPRYVSLFGRGADEDGFITKLVVDFGDGSPRKTFPGAHECVRTGDGWPAPSEAGLPHNPPPYHRYAEPGTYTLTLTAYSTGCDGRQVQTGKKSFTWTVPEPEPSETPSPSETPT